MSSPLASCTKLYVIDGRSMGLGSNVEIASLMSEMAVSFGSAYGADGDLVAVGTRHLVVGYANAVPIGLGMLRISLGR